MIKPFRFICYSCLLLFSALINCGNSFADVAVNRSTSIGTPDELNKFFSHKPNEFYVGVDPKVAKVILIEYGSLTCHHCSSFYLKTIPYLREKYIDKKASLSIIHRIFVSDGPSLMAVLALQCKSKHHSQEKYNKILKTLYATQSDWAFTNAFKSKLLNIFQMYGYTMEEFDKCIADEESLNKILKEREFLLTKAGLLGTPMIVINSQIVSDIRMENIEKELDRLLKI